MEGYLNLYNIKSLEDVYPLPLEDKTGVLDKYELSYWERLGMRLKRYLRYFKRTFHVTVTDYLPPHILGMTDCRGRIWIRRLYGYLRDRVLKHEIIHNIFPYLDEVRVEMLSRAGYIKSLSNFNLVFSR